MRPHALPAGTEVAACSAPPTQHEEEADAERGEEDERDGETDFHAEFAAGSVLARGWGWVWRGEGGGDGGGD